MPRDRIPALGLTAVAVACLLAVAEARQPDPARSAGDQSGGVIELTPEADTWFEIDAARGAPVNPTPRGGSDRLRAGWSDVGIDEEALLRFALPTDLPAEQVARAELVLRIEAAAILTFGPRFRVVADCPWSSDTSCKAGTSPP